MAREMLLAGVDEEELRPDPKPEEPKTPKGKWENFWFYHKTHFWVGIGVAVVLFICIYQMVTKINPDYEGIFVTVETQDQTCADVLRETLGGYMEDVNGDGHYRLSLESLPVGDAGSAVSQMTYTYNMKLQAMLQLDTTKLMVFDQASFDRVIGPYLEGDFDFFAPPDVEAEGYNETVGYWDWYGSSYQQSEWGKKLPEHLYFGVRIIRGDNPGDREVVAHETAKRMLEAFINEEPVDQTIVLE